MSIKQDITAMKRMRFDEEATRDERLSLANTGHIFTVVLFAILCLSLLMAIVAGTSAFKSLHDLRTNVDAARASQNLIVNSIHANDVTDCAAVAMGQESRVLILTEKDGNSSYETRIYLHDGKIVQEYALASAPYTPEKATVLAQSEIFDINYANGLLTITTDQGTSCVALRSVKGGA